MSAKCYGYFFMFFKSWSAFYVRDSMSTCLGHLQLLIRVLAYYALLILHNSIVPKIAKPVQHMYIEMGPYLTLIPVHAGKLNYSYSLLSLLVLVCLERTGIVDVLSSIPQDVEYLLISVIYQGILLPCSISWINSLNPTLLIYPQGMNS